MAALSTAQLAECADLNVNINMFRFNKVFVIDITYRRLGTALPCG